MAVSLVSHEVSDLCIGKPVLRSLSVSATVGDALSALKRLGESYLSVWSCDHGSLRSRKIVSAEEECRCVGKVCMVDVISFLAKEDNLSNPGAALQSSVSVLIPKEAAALVRHLEPHASLLEAIDLILEGAQNLVIPIQGPESRRKKLLLKPSPNLHNKREYCWLTQEDVIRFLLNSIGLFCPAPIQSIDSLNIVDTESIFAVHHDDPAASALPMIFQSAITQTSVAVVDSENKIVGEISPFTLNSCDEIVSAAMATLTAGELMAFMDCGGPEDLIQVVKERLEHMNLSAALELMEEDSGISSSSDEEFGLGRSGKSGVRRSETIVCHPWSSLVAVMIQALSHRLSYVWVIEENGTLAGIVTFSGMMKVFRERLKSM
ncbi:CBS domain-containing protein [Tripterygium wilfordii]|uniref:CBS domain-containing protein n=1 Tax=Tripterygium wilfordii TaxID=458696 RepID=A0A7J7D7B4_TRIWF|nr:CBS domain-containing protein CBSX5-like [Tripterygium wilfordii]KAF5742270.1 CBS domain-containing protein [Tripterygium wilfordii]